MRDPIAPRLRRLAVFAVLLIGTGVAASAPQTSARLTPQELRGKQIYLKGTSPRGGAITAFLGDAGVEVPASTMPCAGCHGLDGQGRPEGGITPSNITWAALTRPYGVTHESGRRHPPYTEKAFELAITRGLDPGGTRLAVAMPRYEMAAEDLADLIAYLKRVGSDTDPGLTPGAVRIGLLIPTDGPLAEAGEVAKAALEARFAEINAAGGVYGRALELCVGRLPAEPAARVAAAERFIEEQQVFALAGAFIAGADREMAALVERREVPLIGPFSLLPRVGFPVNRQVFYLFSGLVEQSRAMVAAAAHLEGPRRLAVIHPEDESRAEMVQAIGEQCEKNGVEVAARLPYAPGRFDAAEMFARLRESQATAVFFLGPGGEAAALLREAAGAGWAGALFMPGALAGRDILEAPANFTGRIFLSFPTLPNDQTAAGLEEYRALAEKHQLGARHQATQFAALSAARVLLEGLRLAGRDLSREKLIAALEGLYEMQTGLTPPITYGPNRRVGALGAYIVGMDPRSKQFTPGDWVTP